MRTQHNPARPSRQFSLAAALRFTTVLAALLALVSLAVPAQSNRGELRLRVTDPSGLGVRSAVLLSSDANEYRASLATNESGVLVVKLLPFGIYQVEADSHGFSSESKTVEIRSELPTALTFRLGVAPVSSTVTVKASDTLIDPDQAGAISQIGQDTIENRLGSIPGRTLQDLVNSQPGWLYEGNAVLHPRGSEYQTQIVVDGIPLTDNRSPSFGPEITADDVQSMSVYTAGIPAEYGRKMGGVVEVNTLENPLPGFHGQAVLSGGSFDTGSAFADAQYSWGKNTFGASASGGLTGHYLNPVVPENFSNTGTLGDFSARFERDLTPNDRIRFLVRHEVSRYDIPNELIQQAAGQRQTANNFETMGIVSYEHTFSTHLVADVRAMVRDNANNFNSNDDSTPIEVFQHNWFREGYFKAGLTGIHGRHEWKAGVEPDNMWLNENFRYHITDPTQFDPGTPLDFSFPLPGQPTTAHRPDLEQAAYIQDRIRLGNWTIGAGLRWDHYQLLRNRQAVDPRFSIARYFPSADLVVHFSYDRIFQTPSFENILLSSSAAVRLLNPISLQLPVDASEGNYYEVGLTKSVAGKLKLDANYFRRLVNNYADDDQIDNTTISFPISFRKAIIYGAEAKLDTPDWRGFSGFVSYTYTVGNAWFPVTGGLFLGDDAVLPTSGHFPDSQDQRNTVRGRVRYRVAPRLWFGFGVQYDTGLPFDFQGTEQQALEQYGPQVVSRINFARGRIYPAFQVNASVGADVYKTERLTVRMQADGQNLNNVLNVIDFGGLFSGNAIGPPRSFALRVAANF